MGPVDRWAPRQFQAHLTLTWTTMPTKMKHAATGASRTETSIDSHPQQPYLVATCQTRHLHATPRSVCHSHKVLFGQITTYGGARQHTCCSSVRNSSAIYCSSLMNCVPKALCIWYPAACKNACSAVADALAGGMAFSNLQSPCM